MSMSRGQYGRVCSSHYDGTPPSEGVAQSISCGRKVHAMMLTAHDSSTSSLWITMNPYEANPMMSIYKYHIYNLYWPIDIDCYRCLYGVELFSQENRWSNGERQSCLGPVAWTWDEVPWWKSLQIGCGRRTAREVCNKASARINSISV